jgi:Zn-dependent protease
MNTPPSQPTPGFLLTRAFGIPVYLESSFLIGLVLIVMQFGSEPVAGFCFAGLLFLSVLLHEFGHALAGRQVGIPTENITLGMLGGVARLRPTKPMTNGQDAWMTIAGPLVNVVLWALCVLALKAGAFADNPRAQYWLGIGEMLNLGLLKFNLLPGWPLDGGRLLVCLLRLFTSEARALLLASYAGQLTAVGLVLTMVFPTLEFSIFRTLIAFHIWSTAGAMRAHLQQR